MNARTSAIDRLRGLPAVFRSGPFLLQSGLTKESAQVLLSRWSTRGLIEPLGGRTGIYFNLIADPNGAETRLGEAVTLRFPEVLVCAASILHAAAWTTQTPHTVYVAVLASESLPTFDRIELCPRPRAWFSAVETCKAVGLNPLYGMRALTPAFAWQDMETFLPGMLGEDDLDENRLLAAQKQIEAARNALSRWRKPSSKACRPEG